MDKLKAVLQWMQGKKTYLGAIAFGALGISWSEHWITDDQAKLIGLLVTAFTGFALRQAIKAETDKAASWQAVLTQMAEMAAKYGPQYPGQAAPEPWKGPPKADVNSNAEQLRKDA